MEDSILKSTKQLVGLSADPDGFDLDILTQINTAFSTLSQLGIPVMYVADSSVNWADLNWDADLLNMIRTYTALKVRSFFDPPDSPHAVDAMDRQISELEWRIKSNAELGV